MRLRGWDPVMGMNLRNARIARQNSSAAIRLVDDKHATKEALASVGAPTSPTLALLRSRREINSLDWDGLPDTWALKPNQGLGGNGILLAFGRGRRHWRSSSGKRISRELVADQLRRILDGDFSPRPTDWALFEPLIRAHPDLARLSHQGLPDIRVICDRDRPRLAMLRLPTRFSGGAGQSAPEGHRRRRRPGHRADHARARREGVDGDPPGHGRAADRGDRPALA
ncbi:sugar-transfer associated ATP-grasp domain-containing protein [Streptomyces sp. LMG1-1-1.1]|uniref:sugar-transfer associated ATP-grasp domain-containing protein n=1 Tax=Streptomyces sp. LMG1-1-1.1 TaxID=3135245 RepID=UPI003465C7EA